MDILKLVKLPIDEFRKEFEYLDNEKFTETENDLNILQWAFLANNMNVIKYLCNNYPYDLKKELSASYLKDENFKNVTLATALPFTYLVRNNPDEINFEDYKETISFAKENDILINVLSKKELTHLLYNEQTRLFNKNFFEYVLNEGYIGEDVINDVLPVLISMNDRSTIIPRGIAELIISKKHFVPSINTVSDFVKIMENLDRLTNLSREVINDFKKNVISSFKKLNNIQSENDLELVVIEYKLSEINNKSMKMDLRKDGSLYESRLLNTNKIGTGLRLNLLLTEIHPNREDFFPVNNKILELIDEIQDVTICLNQRSKDINIEKIIEKQIENFLLLPRSNYEFEAKGVVLKRWKYNENMSMRFTEDIINNNENILKKLENNSTNSINQFRCDWLYYYLATLEENKLLNLFHKDEYIRTLSMKVESDFIKEMIENDLNLIINEKVLTSTINSIHGNKNYYRVNVIENESDLNRNEFGLLKTIFNSKMTLSEINENFAKIKGNENINIKKIIKNIIKNDEIDFSFLINEANSMEKLNLLLNNGVKYPEKINGTKFLHNIVLNKDAEFIDKMWSKNPEINEKTLSSFLRNITCYSESDYNQYEICNALIINEMYKNMFDFIDNKYPELINNEKIIEMLKNYSNATVLGSEKKRSDLFRNNPSIENKNALNSKLIDTNAIFAQIEKSIIQKELIKSEQLVTIKKRI